jgi:hypothetical protein
MNLFGGNSSVFNRLTPRVLITLSLLGICGFMTGCPHNDYTVELRPKGVVIERTLTFYRVDGVDSNGVPNYQEFPTDELAAITREFPAGAVKQDGQRFVAKGEFTGALPNDVGGFGTYTNFSSSLGEAGFYTERFRGNDDLAAQTEKRFRAADQITDLVIGWTRQEFGREHGYKKLKKFLDENFRGDLKNAGLYMWLAEVGSLSNTNATEEFVARYCQYLLERGYVKVSDAPPLLFSMSSDSDSAIWPMLQRLIAEKSGIESSEPLPKTVAALKDAEAFKKSWEHYLSQSDLYRTQMKDWEKKRKSDPKLEAPKPLNAMDDLFGELFKGFSGIGGDRDHLIVRLALPNMPNRTNGKWKDGQVTWDADLAADRALPMMCYAIWSHPDADFQTVHFGRVILEGDELIQYCAWRSCLDDKTARDWEQFLTGLKPGEDLRAQIESIAASPTQSGDLETNAFNRGRKLLFEALKKSEPLK